MQSGVSRLFHNSRFYVLGFTALLSIGVTCFLRITIPGDQLFFIRLEQVFGLLALLYWYIALVLSPLSYLIGKERMQGILFSRRAIGVSAAYFALLHSGVAVWGQLGGIKELAYLPSLFQWSLTFGAIGLLILLVMAATSFDSIIKKMTFRRWKVLHRLGYIGGILVILHVWMVGTHSSYGAVQLVGFMAFGILAGIESYRISTVLAQKFTDLKPREYFYTLFVTLWILWLGLIAAIPALVDNYHTTKHAEHALLQHKEADHA